MLLCIMEKMFELWQLLQVEVVVQEVMVKKGITVTAWCLSLPLAGSDVKVSMQVILIPQISSKPGNPHFDRPQ